MPMFNAADFVADLGGPDAACDDAVFPAAVAARSSFVDGLGAAARMSPAAGLEAVLSVSAAWEDTVGQWLKPMNDTVASLLPSTRAVTDAVLPSTRAVMDAVRATAAVSALAQVPTIADMALGPFKPVYDQQQRIGDLVGALAPLLDQAQRVGELVTSAVPTWDWSFLAGVDAFVRSSGVRRSAGRLFRIVGEVKDVLLDGDLEPVRRFVAKHLRLSPTPDRVQSVALALLEGDWVDGVDLEDDGAVRAALRRRANHGNESESYHVIAGERILLLHEIWTPGAACGEDPEAEAIARVLAREEQFDNPDVPHALARLKTDADRTVAYAWADRGDVTWADAALLADQPEARGEYTRKALRRAGALIRERNRARADTARTTAPRPSISDVGA
ncbi:hypothetical protein [Yinghuangia sp. YIM S09857]|uniref:hypothetical protein n=1 Tax=Yinghuangia sp. YIM S09857 TaxID=3436929 RepID=UPI003F529EF0